MTDRWSILQSLIAAGAGLGGVFLGGYMITRREEKRECLCVEKESGYLAILVVAHLDRLATKCLICPWMTGPVRGAQRLKTEKPTSQPLTRRPLIRWP